MRNTNTATELFGNPVYVHSRKQALDDGHLIDITATAKEAGFMDPMAMTVQVWSDCVALRPHVRGQDVIGRLKDVVWMCRFGLKTVQPGQFEHLFQLRVRNDNRPGEPPIVTLKLLVDYDENGRLAYTIMKPYED